MLTIPTGMMYLNPEYIQDGKIMPLNTFLVSVSATFLRIQD